jgi:hypothetical protein
MLAAQKPPPFQLHVGGYNGVMSLRLSASDAYVVQFLPTGVIRGKTIEPLPRLPFSPPSGLEKDPRRRVLLGIHGSSFLPWGLPRVNCPLSSRQEG